MQSACLQFINALICYPDDIDFRIHLRNEFVRHGLFDALEVVAFHFLLSRIMHDELCGCSVVMSNFVMFEVCKWSILLSVSGDVNCEEKENSLIWCMYC